MTNPLLSLLMRAQISEPTSEAMSLALMERQSQRLKHGDTYPTALGFGAWAREQAKVLRDECDRAHTEGRHTAAHVLLEEVSELLQATTAREAIAEAAQVASVATWIIEYVMGTASVADRPLRIYVAGSKRATKEVKDIQTSLGKVGYEITSAWVPDVEANDGQDPTDKTTRRRAVTGNMAAVASSDLLVAWTVTGTPSATYAEIGAALALGKPVVWVQGPLGWGANIMDASPLVHVVLSADVTDILAAVDRVVTTLDRTRGRPVEAWAKMMPMAVKRLVGTAVCAPDGNRTGDDVQLINAGFSPDGAGWTRNVDGGGRVRLFETDKGWEITSYSADGRQLHFAGIWTLGPMLFSRAIEFCEVFAGPPVKRHRDDDERWIPPSVQSTADGLDVDTLVDIIAAMPAPQIQRVLDGLQGRWQMKPKTGLVDVVLTHPGPDAIKIVKAIREATGWDLKSACHQVRDAHAGRPTTILSCVPRDQGDAMVEALRRLGATVDLVQADGVA